MGFDPGGAGGDDVARVRRREDGEAGRFRGGGRFRGRGGALRAIAETGVGGGGGEGGYDGDHGENRGTASALGSQGHVSGRHSIYVAA